MTRQLLILRHAKSAWDTDVPTDFDRPLAKRGKKDAPRVGNWLYQQQLIPDYILSSPAKRAKKTAIKVCQALHIEKHQINWDLRIYEAPPGRLLDVLTSCPATAKLVLLVGHNPGLEMLLECLCESLPAPQDGKLLPTATVAHLEISDAWSQLSAGAARLISLTRPGALPE